MTRFFKMLETSVVVICGGVFALVALAFVFWPVTLAFLAFAYLWSRA